MPLTVIMIAYHQGGILHQDISARSIMLTQEFTGILNDWDRAVRVDPDSPSPIGHRTVCLHKNIKGHTVF